MTDTELNEAVARKMGVNLDAKNFDRSGFMYLHQYSTSIEAAWEIVEYLKFQGQVVRLSSNFADWTQGKPVHPDWTCVISDWGLSTSSDVEAFSDTAPRAICEAFLKLKDQ